MSDPTPVPMDASVGQQTRWFHEGDEIVTPKGVRYRMINHRWVLLTADGVPA